MTENSDDKVINLFKNSQNSLDRQRFFKGFPYIKLVKDENGNYLKEDSIYDFAKKCFYLVTVMKKNGIGVALYKYKVPYDALLKFLNEFRINKSYGTVIDVERYIPEDLA